jgi:hypothetical protein
VRGKAINIGWGLMILAALTVGDTPILVLLVRISCINAEDNISLIFLPNKMASFGRLGNPHKCLFFLCNWCSSSSFDSESIGNFWGYSTFPYLNCASSTGFFFFKNYGGNE